MTDQPVITVPVDAVLDKLAHGDNWTQNDWSNSEDGMCLHQGIRLCQIQPGDAFLIEQVAAVQGWGTSYNDDDGRTFDDVKQRLMEHREVFPHELEETFGPQWEAVVALVRRAAVLTTDEVSRLHAAWAAAGDAAWDAAWLAAARIAARIATWTAAAARIAACWTAARIAACWTAAWAAAGDAASGDAASNDWDAAQFVARSTAGALVVRDLIGQNGFTQEHYDTLIGPWASVIGPAHPDDK